MQRILLILLVAILSSCNDDCDGVGCPGTLGLTLQLKSETTRADLLANGTFNLDDLQIVDAISGETIPFVDFRDDNEVLIGILDLNEGMERSYEVLIEGVFSFVFNFTESTSGDECCRLTVYEDVTLNGIDFIYVKNQNKCVALF